MIIIVAHPQRQHSYRLAEALNSAHMLGAYCTTVYYRPHTLTAIVARLLPPFWRKKATSRHSDCLSNELVIQYSEFGGLAFLFTHNLSFAKRWCSQVERIVDDRFARKVAKLVAKTGADAVVGYDGHSAVLFEEVRRLSPSTVCIADMSAGNALYLRSVYEKDIQLKPDFSDSLHGWRRVWDPIDVDRTKRELEATDAFLCGSTFVERSLGYSGIPQDKCRVCHYGVDVSAFSYAPRQARSENEPLTFIYLGQVAEHKGISYLLEAFRDIEASRARLICVGTIYIPDSIVASLSSNIELKGMVQHDEVSELLLSADVMIFPSLGDGFALSIMEGFASGLPVVCTDNTGAADCVVEGENGFIVPTQDAAALRSKIDWFLNNRNKIPGMAEAARKCALDLTWDDYYANAVIAITELVEEVRCE